MKLKWYGHAAFGITDAQGRHIVTDPYTPETSGYSPITDATDLVIASSDNDTFHCRHDLVAGDPHFINALSVAEAGGETAWNGLTIRAIQTMEMDGHPYHDPDQNAMYRFEVDGLRIGHMGDVGNPLAPHQVAFLKDLDILLALAGDVPTIRLDDLKLVIDGAAPKLVVPMHFRTLRYRPRDTQWIEAFLSYFDAGQVDFAFDSEITLKPEDMPTETRVLVMDYAR
ncbi:MAG: MBL fold metallo-hydrolase [Pseudomonadota bacterium]